MTTTTYAETKVASSFTQRLSNGEHRFDSDITVAEGGENAGPSPHDLFDASLAACKALTAHWYAKKRGFALERVTTEVRRDEQHERDATPRYGLTVTMGLHGSLTDEQKTRIIDAVSRCPVHKLMTSVDITIDTKLAAAGD